jgi:hypothetical protein
MRQAGSSQHEARPERAPLRSALCRQTHGLSRHRPPLEADLQRRHTASLQRLHLCSVLLLCSTVLMLLNSGRTALILDSNLLKRRCIPRVSRGCCLKPES